MSSAQPSLKEKLVHTQTIFENTPTPVMPKEVIQLNDLFTKEEYPDLSALQNIINKNTFLAGEVIKIANEPQFLKPRLFPVLSIREALQVIGLKRLQNLVTCVAFEMQAQSINLKANMVFSVLVARIACAISEKVKDVNEDEAYLAGLFHNAGCLLLSAEFGEAYNPSFLNELQLAHSVVDEEDARYQTNHTLAGVIIAKRWALDPLLVQTILLHHQPDLTLIKNAKTRQLVAVLQLAIALVTQTAFKKYSGEEVDEMRQNAASLLELEDEFIEELYNQLLS